MKRMEEEDARRRANPKQTSWVGYEGAGWWETKDDGRYGGKGSKGGKNGKEGPQHALDLAASRKARNARLGLSGLGEHMLKHQKDDVETQRKAREAYEARMRVEKLVAAQLKGTEHDFDKGYEDEDDIVTPSSNWVDAADQFLQGCSEQDEVDPTIDRDGE
jgi:hypothetical protein